MAELVGTLAMSHAPQLMLNPEQWGLLNTRSRDPLPVRPELESETLEVKWTKWRRCMAAIEQLRKRLESLSADTVVVVGDSIGGAVNDCQTNSRSASTGSSGHGKLTSTPK